MENEEDFDYQAIFDELEKKHIEERSKSKEYEGHVPSLDYTVTFNVEEVTNAGTICSTKRIEEFEKKKGIYKSTKRRSTEENRYYQRVVDTTIRKCIEYGYIKLDKFEDVMLSANRKIVLQWAHTYYPHTTQGLYYPLDDQHLKYAMKNIIADRAST